MPSAMCCGNPCRSAAWRRAGSRLLDIRGRRVLNTHDAEIARHVFCVSANQLAQFDAGRLPPAASMSAIARFDTLLAMAQHSNRISSLLGK